LVGGITTARGGEVMQEQGNAQDVQPKFCWEDDDRVIGDIVEFLVANQVILT
jgi:hypothetical protein